MTSVSSLSLLVPLRDQLKRSGWRSSDRFKNFLQTRRAGIDFHLGPLTEGADRLELRYRYVTERTNDEGTVDLNGELSVERVNDMMTAVYLRVHERPDASRTFGAKGRAAARSRTGASGPARAPEPDENTQQTTLDF